MPLTASPFLMNDVLVQIGLAGAAGVEYRCQLKRAEWVPAAASTATTVTYETFCETHEDETDAPQKWTLELEGFQAVADATDLSKFLFTNRGVLLDVLLIPQGGVIAADNPGYSGVVKARPTPIGGSANAYASFAVSLPAEDEPVELITPPV